MELLNAVFNLMLVVSCVFFGLLFLGTVFFCGYYFAKGKRRKKRTIKSQWKKRNALVRVFIDFPRALARDFYARDPDSMNIHGMYIFAGEQGSGKTIAAVEFLRRYKKMFPKIKIRSNIGIDFQDGKIEDWREVVGVHNGHIGQIDFLDEIQNWFNSMESKNFPPEMLEEITQERKKHKVIVGTYQVFTRMSKPLREQTRFLCLPVTLLGCLTIVRVYKPILDEQGNYKDKKFIRAYFFVHDEELRNAYNTYEKVERLTKKGFVDRSEQLRSSKDE